jgi:hypothetical protein
MDAVRAVETLASKNVRLLFAGEGPLKDSMEQEVAQRGLDDQININKFNSAELAFYAIDQAEETERSDISVLEGSLRLKYNGIQPPYKTLYTANPAECWLKDEFVNGKRTGSVYIPALPTDNPYLPDNYLAQLDKAFAYDPALLQAYKEGNWSLMVADSVVIPSKYLDDLKHTIHIQGGTKKCVSIDPGLGGDPTAIKVFINYAEVGQKILHTDNPKVIVMEAIALMQQYDVNVVAADSIGIGSSIIYGLNEIAEKMKIKVIPICSAEKALNPEKYFNRRAEMWWEVREMAIDRNLPYPEDSDTRKDLCSVKYGIRNGRILLELKEKTKVRLGRSPNQGDSYVYGIYTLNHIEALKPKVADYRAKREERDLDMQLEKLRGY